MSRFEQYIEKRKHFKKVFLSLILMFMIIICGLIVSDWSINRLVEGNGKSNLVTVKSTGYENYELSILNWRKTINISSFPEWLTEIIEK